MKENNVIKNMWISGNRIIDNGCDVNKEKFTLISLIVIILYKFLLDAIYYFIISEEFFTVFNKDFNLIYYFTGVFAVLVFAFPIVRLYYQKATSSIVVLLLSLIWFIPITTLYSFGFMKSEHLMLCIVYWSIIMTAQLKIPIIEAEPLKRLKSDTITDWIAYVTAAIIAGTIIYIWAAYAEFRIQWNLLEVYDIREESKAYEIPSVLTKISDFGNLIIPLLTAVFLVKKRYLVSALLVVVAIISFSIGGHKTIIFLEGLAILAVLFYKKERINLFAPAASLLAIITLGIYFVLNNYIIASLVFRRGMFLPADLTADYIEYFSSNSTILFLKSLGSMSAIGLEETYTVPYPEIIGLFNGTGSYANNGLAAHAFAEMGIGGIILFPLIIVILLRMVDFFGNTMDKRISLFISIYLVITLLSSSWTSLIFGGDIFVICAILYVFNINDTEVKDEI